MNTRTSGDDDDDSDISGIGGGVSDMRMVSGDMSDSACERVDMNVAASGVNVAAYTELHGVASGAKCDLNAYGGYDSGTCDGGSSTTASEMGERAATRSGGRRRGKRGMVSQSVRRARAAEARADVGVTASDEDE